MANHLTHETSPYLLQHVNNPVDWYPWGDTAFAEAVRREQPILLSVGYSACHWCHVMAHESFDHPQIAALMNAHFVCVKVDREERPDVDETYMIATQAMNQGRGGWPMTVFLTPDKAPFFAGTYFPPNDRHGMPGFGRVLTYFADLWANQRAVLLEQAQTLVAALQTSEPQADTGQARLGPSNMTRALEGWEANFDSIAGGFTSAPKFPPASTLLCMLQIAPHTSRTSIAPMVRTTLDAMANGGIRDPIGGGFARYSTDAAWLVPHFEKMLYDNALLAQAYLAGWVAYQEPRYAEVARETLTFLAREMQAEAGGFYSSFDADSEGVEGKYYVWTPAAVAAVLQDPAWAALVCDYYDITEAGNWEGQSIAHTPRPLATVASKHHLSPEDAHTRIQAARLELLAARQKRIAPHCDDKIITAWNGMAIAAMARGARCLQDTAFLNHGIRAANFALTTLRRPQDGRLWRTHRAGKQHILAYLEDYAFMCTGLLELYEAGAPSRFLAAAIALAQTMVTDFFDARTQAFFHTSSHHEKLFGRRREGHDGATPSATATAAWVLGRLSRHAPDNAAWEALARTALCHDMATLEQAPHAFPTTLSAWDWLEQPAMELAFTIPEGAAAAEQNPWQHFGRLAQTQLPACTVAHGPENSHALLQQRPASQSACTLYVCRNHTCAPPVTEDVSALPGA